MSKTYNIEIRFPGTKKWWYLNQVWTLDCAIKSAQKPYNTRDGRKTRVVEVVKTVVWPEKKARKNAKVLKSHP